MQIFIISQYFKANNTDNSGSIISAIRIISDYYKSKSFQGKKEGVIAGINFLWFDS